MTRFHRMLAIGLLALSTPALAADPKPIPIRVVVVTTFELGNDTGDTPGEFQAWVERLPLPQTFDFPQGYRALRYNPDKQVLGIVTGEGSLHGAASVMALGMDPRFDLSKAYWVVAGIAGINPNVGSVGSAAWAEWVIDRDLNFEIDAREIPKDWPTGHVPLGRTKPYEMPAPALERNTGTNGYHLNPTLVDWAWRLSKNVPLDDTPTMRTIRAGFPNRPNALKPPFVLKGDEVAASDFWIGDLMNQQAERWTEYWTGGKGRYVTTAMEDCGVLQSLTFLAHARKAQLDRVLILRTGANYTLPARGQTAAQLLAQEASEDAALSAYIPSLEAAYRVGSKVVEELTAHWETYRNNIPGAGPP